MYPGIVAQTVLISALFAGVSVVSDRELGFLREIIVAPIGPDRDRLGQASMWRSRDAPRAMLLSWRRSSVSRSSRHAPARPDRC